MASSAGPGSNRLELRSVGLGDPQYGASQPVQCRIRDPRSRCFSLSGEYLWKFTYGAYDFDVLLNSPLTFPTQFRKSKIDGASGAPHISIQPTASRISYHQSRTLATLRARDLAASASVPPYSNVARPDHDEGLAMNLNLRYQFGRRGPWIAVPIATMVDSSQLLCRISNGSPTYRR